MGLGFVQDYKARPTPYLSHNTIHRNKHFNGQRQARSDTTETQYSFPNIWLNLSYHIAVNASH